MNLKNNVLNVEISNKNLSEITSIKNSKIEYIWQKKKEIWNRSSPILFPFIGKNKYDKFLFENHEFSIPIHGFCNIEEINVKESIKSDIKAEFILKSSEKTKKYYPFDFILKINYELKKNRIISTWNLKNISNVDMFFQIGAHPSFVTNLNDDDFEDYYIEFEKEEDAILFKLNSKGYICDEKFFIKNLKVLKLKYNLFDKDAIILEGLKSDFVTLKSKKGKHGVKISLFNKETLAFWTERKNNIKEKYICIEPWYGKSILESDSCDLKKRSFMKNLKQNESFKASYYIEIF